MERVTYTCCDERRLAAVKAQAKAAHAVNGIEFLEVDDDPAKLSSERQKKLFVHFVNPLAARLGPQNVRIEGGDRIRDIEITAAEGLEGESILTVEVASPGDFSTYTLRLVESTESEKPPAG